MIYADQRWIGDHGIGRFAREVLEGLRYEPIPLSSHPAAPLDSWRMARALTSATPKDVFFSPGYNSPLFFSSRLVFTIHDLSHIFCVENSSRLIRLYYETIVKRACRRAFRIFTVSEFTRRQISDWSGVPFSKVFNVSCGVAPTYSPQGDVYGLPFPYLLCVSNRKLHKNEFRILEAFATAKIDDRIHLVFTGSADPALTRWIEVHDLSHRIDFLGRIPEPRLPSLYRGALGLVFASLYEGFGLPIVEAMACGTPVITSNRAAMPETAGGAAMLVDPTSTQTIAEVIQQVANDPSIRWILRENGLVRASHFSWDRTRNIVHELLAA